MICTPESLNFSIGFLFLDMLSYAKNYFYKMIVFLQHWKNKNNSMNKSISIRMNMGSCLLESKTSTCPVFLKICWFYIETGKKLKVTHKFSVIALFYLI